MPLDEILQNELENIPDPPYLIEIQKELDFLRWFYAHSAFGPADDDGEVKLFTFRAKDFYKQQYIEETRNKIPEGYTIQEIDEL